MAQTFVIVPCFQKQDSLRKKRKLPPSSKFSLANIVGDYMKPTPTRSLPPPSASFPPSPKAAKFVLRTHFLSCSPSSLLQRLRGNCRKVQYVEAFLDEKKKEASGEKQWRFLPDNTWVGYRQTTNKNWEPEGNPKYFVKRQVRPLPGNPELGHWLSYEQLDGKESVEQAIGRSLDGLEVLATFETTRYLINDNAFVDVVDMGEDYYIIGTVTYCPDTEAHPQSPFDGIDIYSTCANSKVVEWLAIKRPSTRSTLAKLHCSEVNGHPDLHFADPLEDDANPPIDFQVEMKEDPDYVEEPIGMVLPEQFIHKDL